MDKDNLWTRRSNTQKLSLDMNKTDRQDGQSGQKRFVSSSKSNPFSANTPISASSVASPTTGGASAFALGSGAFGSFGSATKTPKTPGTAFDFAKAATTPSAATAPEKKDLDKDGQRSTPKRSQSYLKAASSGLPEQSSQSKVASTPSPLKYTWIIWYRQPTPKHIPYEKSTKPMLRMSTVEDFWRVYIHLFRPSKIPAVSDYHFFKEGIRPFWEDEENKKGGKWTLRLKKGVADRYWEDLLLAMIGDQFGEAGEEVCGAVVSARNGEDNISVWTKNDGGRNVKIRETIKRVLALPPDTVIEWKSHDVSIGQHTASDQARQEKQQHSDKRKIATIED